MSTLAGTNGLAVSYGGPAVLRDVSFEVEPGQRIAVLGPNGGGKTTLFRALLGELPPAAGTIERHTTLATVAQTERSRLDFPVSALDVALLGALPRLAWWQRPARADRERACEALAQVGLDGARDATFGELSGGQRQRVLIARALVQEAGLLLLDEPFTGLDTASATLLHELLAALAAEGRAILIATHALEHAYAWDRVLCLNRRQIAFGVPGDTLDRHVLEATYGEAIVPLPGADDEPEYAVLPPHHHDHD